jgi:Ran GTPase-activating protein (RanGAP) involved in mRNA processing and transport/GTPase SAR1 family protein
MPDPETLAPHANNTPTMARLSDEELIALLERAEAERWETLDLRAALGSPEQVSLFVDRLPRLSGFLKTLNLSYNGFGFDIGLGVAEDTEALAHALAKLTALTTLDLSFNSLGGDDVKSLADALAGLTALNTLHLWGNQFSDAGIKSLSPALKQLTSLTTLDLWGNGITDAGVETLAPALAKLTALKTLDLWLNGIGDAGARALAPALARLTALDRLHLRSIRVGDDGAKALAPALTGLTGLSTLELKLDRVGDAGAEGLASALAGLTDLNVLELNGNRIGNAGIEALVPALAKLTGLNRLVLGSDCIGDAGAKALARALGRLTVLNTLDLGYGGIGDAGAEALAPVLVKLAGLETMDLRGNYIGDVGAIALLDAVRKAGSHSTLEFLGLHENPIDIFPDELLRSGDPAAMLRWLDATEKKPLWAAKVVILGNGRMGKTHFRKRVFEDVPFYYKKDEESTHNIEHLQTTTTASVADPITKEEHEQEIDLRVWDFGGQEMLHSSHRFFLADNRNLFVILADATKTRDENRLDYWLKMVRFETDRRASRMRDPSEVIEEEDINGPPVIVIITGCDKVATGETRRLDLPGIGTLRRETASNVIDIIDGFGWRDKLVLEVRDAHQPTHLAAIARINAAIAATVPGIPGVATPYPGAFFSVAEWIEDNFPHAGNFGPECEKSQKMLARSAYIKACKDAELDTSLHDICLRDMRNLGLFHFAGDQPGFEHSNDLANWLFNPRWVKGPVYTIIRASTGDHSHGILSPAQFDRLLPCTDQGDPDADELAGRLPFHEVDRNRVLSLMKACELVYEVEASPQIEKGSLLVPDLLERDTAAFSPPKEASGWTMHYPFLPEWVFLRFVGRTRDLVSNARKDLFRDEVTLTDGENSAIVRVDMASSSVDIWVSGPVETRRSLYAFICKTFGSIYFDCRPEIICLTEDPDDCTRESLTPGQKLWCGAKAFYVVTVQAISEGFGKSFHGTP